MGFLENTKKKWFRTKIFVQFFSGLINRFNVSTISVLGDTVPIRWWTSKIKQAILGPEFSCFRLHMIYTPVQEGESRPNYMRSADLRLCYGSQDLSHSLLWVTLTSRTIMHSRVLNKRERETFYYFWNFLKILGL